MYKVFGSNISRFGYHFDASSKQSALKFARNLFGCDIVIFRVRSHK